MDHIHYTCKNCGWKASIITQWSDLKPKKCVGRLNGKACETSFLKNPELLLIDNSALQKDLLSDQKGN